jgi:hypothetical protein
MLLRVLYQSQRDKNAMAIVSLYGRVSVVDKNR